MNLPRKRATPRRREHPVRPAHEPVVDDPNPSGADVPDAPRPARTGARSGMPAKRDTPRRRSHPVRPDHDPAPDRPDPLAWRDDQMAVNAAAIARTPHGHGDCMGTPWCPPDPHRGAVAHHVHQRSLGGTDHPLNLLWLCHPGHRGVHDNIARSYALGLLASTSPPWPDPDD